MTEKKRLAIAMNNLGVGGAQRAMVTLIRGLDLDAWTVTAIVFSKKGTYAKDLPDNVGVVAIGMGLLQQIVNVRKFCKANPDTIILTAQTRSSRIFALSKKLGLIHNILVIREPNRITKRASGLIDRLWAFFLPTLYKNSDRFIGLSETVRDDIANLVTRPRDTIPVIPNSVDLDRIQSMGSQPSGHPFLVEKSVPVILGVGRLVEQKAFDVLIAAVALVRRETRVRLMILGEGELDEKLRQQARDLGLGEDFDLPGFQENPYSFMARADVFVLSSRWEGSPNALLEAMAVGAPVVACDCPSGPREIVVSEELGKLCPVDDPEALAQAILATLANPGDANARQDHIRRNHGIEAWTDAYVRAILGE